MSSRALAFALGALADRRVGDPPTRFHPVGLVGVGEGAAFRRELLLRGFAVRDCASFGLPRWVRVAVPDEAAARRLIPAFLEALRSVRRRSEVPA